MTGVMQLEKWNILHPDAYTFFQHHSEQPSEPDGMAAIMTQLSLEMGMKPWKGKAEEAARAEVKQLHVRDMFAPVHYHQLTQKDLESHMCFLKTEAGR